MYDDIYPVPADISEFAEFVSNIINKGRCRRDVKDPKDDEHFAN